MNGLPNHADLAGAWTFGHVPATDLWQSDDLARVQEWLPATVPGNLESDLVALKRIPDPFLARQNEQGRWVENLDWWYRRHITLPLGPGQRAHLILHGVDYYSAVYANATFLGTHEGMFARQSYEITGLLQASHGELDLAVRLWGAHALPRRRLQAWQQLADPLLRRIVPGVDMFPARINTLKCQMSFGWDFAPRLPTIGIWDDAEIVVSGPVYISDVQVQSEQTAPDARLTLRLALDSAIEGTVRATIKICSATFPDEEQAVSIDTSVVLGRQMKDLAVKLENLRLWQPWDRGQPNLYDLSVTIQPGRNLPASAIATTFGLRSVELTDWHLFVNGEKEFMRGVNWVPADALPGRLRRADYAELIGLARAANANLLRVWGGGLREKRAFYDLCDRMGMLVWQELPLACPNLSRFPTDQRFLDLLDQESSGIVRELRNHPSLILWCGGNEFGPARNKQISALTGKTVAAHDSGRPWRAASPSPGDHHNWRVWHHRAPLHEYLRERAPLVSEFGLQSAPNSASLRQFIPEGELWPPGPAWAYHNAGLAKLGHYAQTFLAPGAAEGKSKIAGAATLAQLTEATQRAQARGIQMLVEHMRRRADSGGVIIWQLIEPWPSICWSLIGYDRQPKLAYDMLKRVYNPLLISVEYPIRLYCPGDAVPLTLWLINDTTEPPSPAPLALHLALNERAVYETGVTLKPGSSAEVAKLDLRLPEPPWLLRCELRQGDSVLAQNDYDLAYHDERHMPVLHRAMTVFGAWLLR